MKRHTQILTDIGRKISEYVQNIDYIYGAKNKDRTEANTEFLTSLTSTDHRIL